MQSIMILSLLAIGRFDPVRDFWVVYGLCMFCLLYTSPSPRD